MLKQIAIIIIFHAAVNLAYKATVVEYDPITGGQPSEIIRRNIEKYRETLENVGNGGIIVFPEYGLTGMDAADNPEQYSLEVPEPLTPTIQYGSYIRELSVMALEHSTYLVVNLLEKNGTLYYNTNVVFARNGTLIARYRKIRLYLEPKLTAGTEAVSFSTDFGEFGIFTCYDILFKHPSITTLQKASNISNVVYPASWFSTLPFFISSSVQAGYATANGVNLLSAGYSRPKDSHSGTSIILSDGSFSKDGVYIGGVAVTKAITQEIPYSTKRYNSCDKTLEGVRKDAKGLDVGGSEFDNFKVLSFFEPDEYKFHDLDLTSPYSGEVSKNGLTCNASITASNYNSSEHFKLVVGGERAEDGFTYVFCALLTCTSNDKKSCGKVNETTTRFSEIILRTHYISTNETYERPVTINGKYIPLSGIRFCSTKCNEDKEVNVEISIRDIDNVAVFGIIHTNSAATFAKSILYLAIVNLILKFVH